MVKTWILIANASHARIYARNGNKAELSLVKELAHPESRLKNADLVTDKSGLMQGTGHGSRQPPSTPKHNEALHFAQELAQTLNQGRCSHEYEEIILVAPPAFMGLINEKMDGQTAKLVTEKMGKDYTHSNEREIVAHLLH